MLEFVKRLFGRKETSVSFSGGDGCSPQSAVVIGVDDPTNVVRAEYEYIEKVHGPRNVAWKLGVQMKTKAEGRKYDVISIVLVDGAEKVVWFEING